MKVIHDSITDELYEDITKELKETISSGNWSCSLLKWEWTILRGVKGACLFTRVSDTLKHKIVDEIKQYFPKDYTDYIILFYIWTYNSGIPSHDDGHNKAAATLYLNENWSVDYGGIFIWEDESLDGEKHRCVCPKKKTMVVNDKHEFHLVTPVSQDAPEYRYTIQIRVRKNHENNY